MNDIVKGSNLSKGAIYDHFESKERLFLTLWERQYNLGKGQVAQLFSPDDTAADKMLKLADMVLKTLCESTKESGRMLLEFMISASRIDALESDLKNRYNAMHSPLVEIIEEGIKNGEFKADTDSKSLSSILFATLEGLSLHYLTLGINFDAKKIEDTLMNVVLKGIMA
jgi:AcrR family transcriptional regulator